MAVTLGLYADASFATSTTAVVTLGTTVAGGAIVVGVVYSTVYSGSQTVTVTDNKGNTYTQIGTTRNSANDFGVTTELWYATDITGGAGHAVTASVSGSDIYPSAFAQELRGSGIVLDESGGTSGGGTEPFEVGPITPTANGAVIVSFLGLESYYALTMDADPLDWVSDPDLLDSNSYWPAAMAVLEQGTAAAVQADWEVLTETWASIYGHTGHIAAFVEDAGGTGGEAPAATLTATASLSASPATGGTTAHAATLAATAALLVGMAVGGSVAPSATLSTTASLVTSPATAGTAAPSVTVSATASLTTSVAAGGASAPAATWAATASWTPTAAAGGASAPPATLASTGSMVAVSASGGAAGPSTTWTASATLLPGTVVGGTAPAATWASTAWLLADSAIGGGAATGATVQATASLSTVPASGGGSGAAPARTFITEASLSAHAAVGGAAAPVSQWQANATLDASPATSAITAPAASWIATSTLSVQPALGGASATATTWQATASLIAPPATGDIQPALLEVSIAIPGVPGRVAVASHVSAVRFPATANRIRIPEV